MTCPLCGDNHSLSQCPRWRAADLRPFVFAGLCIAAPVLVAWLLAWNLAERSLQ